MKKTHPILHTRSLETLKAIQRCPSVIESKKPEMLEDREPQEVVCSCGYSCDYDEFQLICPFCGEPYD